MIGEDIPDGQGSVTTLLEECFELAYDLRTEAEENGSDKSDSEDEQATAKWYIHGDRLPTQLSFEYFLIRVLRMHGWGGTIDRA